MSYKVNYRMKFAAKQCMNYVKSSRLFTLIIKEGWRLP